MTKAGTSSESLVVPTECRRRWDVMERAEGEEGGDEQRITHELKEQQPVLERRW